MNKKRKKLSCIRGEIPNLPHKLSQREMTELAIRDINARKKGKYRLVYDKVTRTISAEEEK